MYTATTGIVKSNEYAKKQPVRCVHSWVDFLVQQYDLYLWYVRISIQEVYY